MLTQLTNRIPVVIKSIFKRKLDATELLTRHHLKLEVILLRLRIYSEMSKRGFGAQREDLQRRFRQTFETLLQEFGDHVRMEESVFYPECEKFERINAMIEESYGEHSQIETLLNEMLEVTLDSETFSRKLNTLTQKVELHIMEEEEEIFPLARRQIGATRLQKMAHQMRSGKKKSKKSSTAA